MKPLEKKKTQLIINRIQQGNFDLNDIDNLFMKLRAFSGDCKVFKDISHFVAHNNERDTGLAKDGIESLYLRMKFFASYRSVHNLNLQRPFPTWIKRTLYFQLELKDEKTLARKFDKNKIQIKNILDRSFRDDKKSGTTQIKQYREEIFQVVRVLLGWLIIKPVYTGDELMAEILEVFKLNKIKYSKEEILLQRDRIMVSVLLLFHKTRFLLKDRQQGECFLGVDKVDGTLECFGRTPFDYPGKKYLRLVFVIFSSGLKAENWLNRSLSENLITADLDVSEDFEIKLLKL